MFTHYTEDPVRSWHRGNDTPVKAKLVEVSGNAEYLLGSLRFAFRSRHLSCPKTI
jgi:hypothetical protein